MGDTMDAELRTRRTHYEGCWRHEHHHACAVVKVEQLQTKVVDALVAEVERLREELEFHKELYVFSEDDMGMMRAQRDGARDVCAFYRKQMKICADYFEAAPPMRYWSTRYWRELTKGKKNE